MTIPVDNLTSFLDFIAGRIRNTFEESDFFRRLPDGLIKDHILAYSIRGGKNLRPGLFCAAAGVVGADPQQFLTLAAAIEMFHTWTLVHDDIIDRDDSRRGGPTMQVSIRNSIESDWSGKHVPCEHIANSLAILVGDAQQGMTMNLIAKSAKYGEISPEMMIEIIDELEGDILPAVMEGEVEDMLQTRVSLDEITPDDIIDMLRKKTGAMLSFSLTTGARVGLNTLDRENPLVKTLKTYGDHLGLAFQIRDDILGVAGSEEKLGKPIGSDFREGKRTLVLKYAYDHAGDKDRQIIRRLIDKGDLTHQEIETLRGLLIRYGGIRRAEERARHHIEKAGKSLEKLPENIYRSLLGEVLDFLLVREK